MRPARAEWLGPPRVRVAAVIALVAIGLVPALTRGDSLLGSWKVALDCGTFGITTLGPVAAGIACTVYVRIRRAGMPELLGQAARPWVGWCAPALGVWLLASLAVVLICLITTTAAWAAGANAFPELSWVILPALVVLGAEVAVGALIGSLAQRYWAAPWAAVAAFTLYILSSVGVIPAVFRTGGVTGSMAAETFRVQPLALQALAALGLAAAALALSQWDLFRASHLGNQVLTTATAIAAAVALLGLNGDDDERYVFVEEVVYECREGTPTVCMTEETTRPLDDLAAKMRRLAEPLVAAGIELPDRFVQEAGPTSGGHDGSLRLLDEDLSDRVSSLSAARSLAQPADCSAYSSDDPRDLPETWFYVDDVLVRWLLVQDGQEAPPPGEHPLAAWWEAPRRVQLRWVRSTYDALRECRLFDLRLPHTPR